MCFEELNTGSCAGTPCNGLARSAIVCTLVLLTASSTIAQDGFGCDDFASQAAAQTTLNQNPADPHGLEPDGNGIACDHAADAAAVDDDTPASTGVLATEEAEAERPPLDARLGGTLESWEAEFGPPIERDDTFADLFPEYDIPGYSGVYADEHLGRIESIHLFSPRPDGVEWSNDEPHPMDWSIPKAHELAKRFLPRDAQYGEPDEERFSGIATECYSDSLAAEVPTEIYDYVDNNPVYGGCWYWLDLHLDDESKVTNITVSLQIEEPLSWPAPRLAE